MVEGDGVAKRRYYQQKRELEVANRNKLINGDRIQRMTQKLKPVKLLQDEDWLQRQENSSSILTTKNARRNNNGGSSSSSRGRGRGRNGNIHAEYGSVVTSVSRNVGNSRSYSPPRYDETVYRTTGSIGEDRARDGLFFDDSVLGDNYSAVASVNFDTISSVRQRFKRGGTRWWKILYEPKFKPSLRPATLDFSGSLSRSSRRTPHQPLWKLERISNVHMPHFTQAFSDGDKFVSR